MWMTSAVCVTWTSTFDEPMKYPLGAEYLSGACTPTQLWDPKPGHEATHLNCGFSKASETAPVEVFLFTLLLGFALVQNQDVS